MVLDDFLKLYNHAYLDEVRLEEKNKGSQFYLA